MSKSINSSFFLPFFLSFFLSLTNSTYSCRCKWWLLHLITLNDTHSHTYTHTHTLTHAHTHTHSLSLANSHTHTHTHFSLFFIWIFLRPVFLLLLLFVLSIFPFVLYFSSVLYIFPLFLLSWHSLTFIFVSFFPSFSHWTLSAASLDEGSARHGDLQQHTTLTTHRHSCRRRDSNPQSRQATGPRPHGQWTRPLLVLLIVNITPLLPNQNLNQF